MAITAGYYGIGYKANGVAYQASDTINDRGGTERTIAGGYTTFATAIADIGALTGDIVFGVGYSNISQSLSFPEHIAWPNIDQNNYRIGFVGQIGSVGVFGSQGCIDAEAEGLGNNTLNISTGTDARNGWYMHNLRLHAADSTRAFYEGTSQTYPTFTQCTFTGTINSIDLMYVSAGNFVAHDCVIISRNGIALIPANGTSLIRCIIISTSSYALGGAAFTDIVGCTIYGNTYGMYGFSCAGSFRDNIVVGGTHAIYSAYVQGRLTYITSRNNNLFYSVSNPTEISTGKTTSEYFGDDYQWMDNNFLSNPLFSNIGGYTVEDYALEDTSPAKALNQTPTDNLVYSGNKNDPLTFGVWNNYSAPSYPSENKVLYNTFFNSNSSSGNYSPVETSNVRYNTTYGSGFGIESTGILVIPPTSGVLNTIYYDSSGIQGSWTKANSIYYLYGQYFGIGGISDSGSLVSQSDSSITPSGLQAFDAHTSEGGTIYVTITNKTDYSSEDLIAVYNNSTNMVLDAFIASVGSGNVCDLTNDQEYTVYAMAIESGKLTSGKSNTASATPTTTQDITAPSRPTGLSLDAAPEAPNITGIG